MICELYSNGNNFTSVDHSVYFLSSPFIIHRRYSCNEPFMPSTSPFVHRAWDVLVLCFIL